VNAKGRASLGLVLGLAFGLGRNGIGQTVPEQLRTVTPAIMALNVTMAPYNVQPYDARTTAATQDMGPRIQAAMNDACAYAATQPGKGPPIVYIPRGQYLYKTTLTVPCSGLTVKGDGISATQLYQAAYWNSSNVLLTVGTHPGAGLSRVTLEDLSFSASSNHNNIGGITLACRYCHLNRVGVYGTNNFAIEFTGAAFTGTGGWSDLNQCEIQVPLGSTGPAFAFQVTSQAGAVGGPDGIEVHNTNVNVGALNGGFIRFVSPGTQTASSTGWIGNRFMSLTNGAPIVAITGTMQDARFVGNRWEQTGSGGLNVRLGNPTSNDPPAVFIDNLWACGSGGCTWADAGGLTGLRSLRYGDYGGNSGAFFTNQTSTGLAVSLSERASAIGSTPLVVSTGIVPGSGFYRATTSMILTKAGTTGVISTRLEWNNGVHTQSDTTAPLATTAPVGTEVDGSFLFYSAENSPITYQTTFASVAGSPQYTLRIRLEFVGP
jgi:hypothetical protein